MIQLETLKPDGIPIIAVLYGAAFLDDRPIHAIRTLLDTPGTQGLLASIAEETDTDQTGLDPAGFVLYRQVLDEAEILSIGVRPDRRREGMGRMLLHAVHTKLAEQGAATIFLEVGQDNPGAIALYEGIGYTRVGIRRNYYRRENGKRVNATIMKHCLTGSESK